MGTAWMGTADCSGVCTSVRRCARVAQRPRSGRPAAAMTHPMRFPPQPLRPAWLAAALTGNLVAAGLLLGAGPLRAQDLLGCQLTDAGQLQCVPGISADPQAQIRALRQELSTDLQMEGAVQQRIDGLQQLVVQGQALEGQLLQASLVSDRLAGLPPSAFHWYRRQAGASHWLLIANTTGPSYVLSPADVGSDVMVVVAVPTATGSQRQASRPIGPVQMGQP